MLKYGFRHAWFQQHPEASAPAPVGTYDFGRPAVFVPQKARAMKRAKLIAAALAALGLLGLVGLLAHFLG